MAAHEERFVGCLLGGAIGDALGMPLKNLTREEIAELGAQHEFAPARSIAPIILPLSEQGDTEVEELLGAGQWTENTQLTLALAECLIEEHGLLIPEAWSHVVVRWLNDAPRAPENSTLEAALNLRAGGLEWDEGADEEGVGCAAAARVAPIGLLYAEEPARRHLAALTQAQVTHGHSDAQAASIAVAEAVAFAASTQDGAEVVGAEFLDYLAKTVEAESPEYAEFARCILLARTLLLDDVDEATAIRVLGVSEWARECVPCAFYCIARSPGDFEAAITRAINLTGGSVNSIASIAGAVCGAFVGIEGIPIRWRAGVEEATHIVATAMNLFQLYSSQKE